MVVSELNYKEFLHDINHSSFIGFDTETYGLKFEDSLFALCLSTDNGDYYLNFHDGPDHLDKYSPIILSKKVLKDLEPRFQDTNVMWASHNAIFDLQKIALEGINPPLNVHCTLVTERIIENTLLDLSLEHTAETYGFKKLDIVDAYIKTNKLYSMVEIPGKDKREKIKHFSKVPFHLLAEYGANDAKIHRGIALMQRYRYLNGLSKRNGTY